ncbi:MAG: MoaD/ThiS family protein [Firmicutes bacterium]|nr:MoaD/ThiS family protein [Bacillota bacterium]
MAGARIRVEYFPGIIQATGGRRSETVELADPTLAALWRELVTRYGRPFEDLLFDSSTGKFSRYIIISINGVLTHDREGPLQDGDEVAVSPILSGGG